LPLPSGQKKSPGLFALSCSDTSDFFGVSPVEFLNAVSDQHEIPPVESLNIFERPVEALEDGERVG
jgi:hypothetical protein